MSKTRPLSQPLSAAGTAQKRQSSFGPLFQGCVFALLATGHLLLIIWLFEHALSASNLMLAVLTFVVTLVNFRQFDLFDDWHFGRAGATGIRVLGAWCLLGVGLIVIGFLTKQTEEYSRLVTVIWLTTTPVWFVAAHAVARYAVLPVFPQIRPRRSAVVVFVNNSADRLVGVLDSLEKPRFEVRGFFEDRCRDRAASSRPDLPILGSVCDLANYVNEHGIDVVFVVLQVKGSDRVASVAEQLGDTTASIYYVPDFQALDLSHIRFTELGGMPVLALMETPFFGADGWFKRTIDVIFAAAFLIFFAPLFALVALAIRLRMGRPIFFTQKRYGLDGREIEIYKFRTMYQHPCDGESVAHATRDDPRTTPLGRFLRRTSIDEWPQFWNVLRGEMSVVGPRPHAVAHNEQYRKLVKRYMVRHKVRPGLTGWAQVNGLRGEIKNLSDMKRRVRYDLDYIQNWSPELDLRIVFRTVWLVFRDHEAY